MNKIKIGSKVIVRFDGNGEEAYKIVDSAEADPINGKISANSLFAQALIGKHINSKIKYRNSNNQIIKCQVVAVINS